MAVLAVIAGLAAGAAAEAGPVPPREMRLLEPFPPARLITTWQAECPHGRVRLRAVEVQGDPVWFSLEGDHVPPGAREAINARAAPANVVGQVLLHCGHERDYQITFHLYHQPSRFEAGERRVFRAWVRPDGVRVN